MCNRNTSKKKKEGIGCVRETPPIKKATKTKQQQKTKTKKQKQKEA